MRGTVWAVGCMPMLDCVILSARPTARPVVGNTRAPPCLPLPPRSEVRPFVTAGSASIRPPRYPPRPRLHSAGISYRNSNLTPRITRRPARSPEHDIPRVGGRVHAVVRLRATFSPSPAMPQARGEPRLASCLPLPAAIEVRPTAAAGNAASIQPRYPPRLRFHYAKGDSATAI
jgi:hypothetical protein